VATPLVPELGPALGELIAPPTLAGYGSGWVALDDVRLGLVTALFDLAGAARGFELAGDSAAAVSSLARPAWLAAWERALAAATDRLTAVVDERFAAAAAESRLPVRRRAALAVTAEERRALEARLGAAAAGFVAALDALEEAGNNAARSGGLVAWREALLAAARRLETAWAGLERAAGEEERRWAPAIERVRRWRRPVWPLWVASAVVVAGAAYLGLVLGGYLPVPAPLAGLADWVWSW
jgi:hypothetical protein